MGWTLSNSNASLIFCFQNSQSLITANKLVHKPEENQFLKATVFCFTVRLNAMRGMDGCLVLLRQLFCPPFLL